MRRLRFGSGTRGRCTTYYARPHHTPRPPLIGHLLAYAVSAACLFVSASAFAQFLMPTSNPFAGPSARTWYAPDRAYDLRHVAVRLNVDYAKLVFRGTVTNTVAPLRGDLSTLDFHCGKGLTIERCAVEGRPAEFARDDEFLRITPPIPVAKGRPIAVEITYESTPGAQGGGFMGGGGWHWIRATPDDTDHVGFWTQGEEMNNRAWAPTWDYPNDFATSETITTVPENWYVVGNGDLVSTTTNKAARTRTFHWRMTQPHATYLLSLAAGPMDIKWSTWQGVKLLYAVPRGRGSLIDGSFGDTPDMLAFFSQVTGVKYPWSKYAQTSMYGFGGGMENVSATTLDVGSLNNGRVGYRAMASLNSHELAHQWFGDLVTCRDWGQVWLNESFATFMEAAYMEHSRGKAAYDQEIEGNSQSYFGESRAYVRPLATKVYVKASDLFDRHAYPKGSVVLHTLRRMLGDEGFWAGIRLYLERCRHTPATTSDLEKAMTDATGISIERFMDQWVLKPGHPVLQYDWRWDADARQVVANVRQVQDTSTGTPIYDHPIVFGLISDGKLRRETARLSKAEQEFRFAAAGRPDALLIDPDHDFLREIPKLPWTAEELPHIVRLAPSATDRRDAAARLLSGEPSDEAVRTVMDAVRADRSQFPVFTDVDKLTRIQRPEMLAFWRDLMGHANAQRRATAIRMVARLSSDPADLAAIGALVAEKEPDPVIEAAVDGLADKDAVAHAEVLARAARMTATTVAIRSRAASALASTGSAAGLEALLACAAAAQPKDLRIAAVKAMADLKSTDPRVRAALRAALKENDVVLVLRAVQAATERKDKELLADIRAVAANPPTAGSSIMKEFLSEALKDAEAALGS